ncbi:MAG: nitroreductase family protein [Egibacteraceae bacterium]
MDALECIATRRSPTRLIEPAPDEEGLARLLGAAVAAPDHGRLRPWRFVVARGQALQSLGEAFAAAHAERDPSARPAELARTRAKALRAPLVLVVIASLKPSEKVPAWEQLASAACSAQHVQLAAHALGYGSMWRTGWIAGAPKVRAHLGLQANEQVVAFLYLGTVPQGAIRPPRPPLVIDTLVTRL